MSSEDHAGVEAKAQAVVEACDHVFYLSDQDYRHYMDAAACASCIAAALRAAPPSGLTEPKCLCGAPRSAHPTGVSGHVICEAYVQRPPSGLTPPREGLTFADLRAQDVPRCNEAFPPYPDNNLESWSLTDWAAALAGEVGEACNVIKKIRRGDRTLDDARQDIAKELADVVIYCDLLAARAGIDLGESVAAKFNEVSQRVGSPRRLLAPTSPVAGAPEPHEH